MSPPRILLPWKAPVLASAAAWLMQRYPGGDMGKIIVVLPASRAGRRLEELLLDACEREGLPLVPPRITTVGYLPDLLHHVGEFPPASTVEQRLAWIDALRHADPDGLAPIAPHPPAADDMLGWASLAESLSSLLTELAGEGLRPADVAEQGTQLPDFSDAEQARWLAIDHIYDDYLIRLNAMQRSDPDAARWEAVEHGDPPDADVVVVAGVDLNKLQRATLDRLIARLTLLTCAPEEFVDGFDGRGCLNADGWAAASIVLEQDQIRIVDRPSDQAAAVVQWLAEHAGRFTADQLTIGVCDEQVAPALEQRLRGHRVPVRHAAGTPITFTGPYRLLAAVAGVLERGRFADFAALIRHPDVGQWLLQRGGDTGPLPPEAIDSWINLLDRYYNDHLQARLTSQWLGREEVREPMRRLFETLHDPAMLGDLAAGVKKPPRQWAKPIHQLLLTVYGYRPLERFDAADRLVIESCERLNESLVELYAAPEGDGVCEASVALRLVLSVAGSQTVPPPAEEAAVELVGPLELPLDDAGAILITGLNEGRWPQSVSAHPFLPDMLRRHLGMVDNHRRHARDVYALSMILAQDRPILLIAGRRDAEGNPLLPSRLLLADEPLTLARRIAHFYGENEPANAAPAPAYPLRAGACNTFRRPDPVKLQQPFHYLRVTDFKRYLECPYRFYLGRALNLGPIHDAAMEMDGMRFGSLAHEVLDCFGRSELKDSSREKEIRGRLTDMLHQTARDRFGEDPLPAVRIQVEQLRQRLSAFAAVQAQRAREGWVIHCVEQDFRGESAWLTVDDEPMYLRGRIDRMDHHPETGRWAVLDYKTSAGADGPDQTHRRGRAKAWVDLQLPLYRHLVRFLRVDNAPLLTEAQLHELRLGYVLLPARVEDVQFALADWTAADLAAADRVAAEVIQHVRAERFEFNPATRIDYDDFAVICGTGQRFGHSGAGSGGEEE